LQIRDSVFLVTGASSGLGAATVRRVVAGGAKAILADVNREAGEALASELGANAKFVQTDVTDEANAQNAVDAAISSFGALHVLVNCAGVAPGERVVGREAAHKLSSFARTIQINLVGTFNMLRLAAKAMSTQTPNAGGERGVIITTASVAAFDGQIGQAAYAASKAGVAGMTLPIARELAKFGIRVMTIAPGIFETPMVLGFTEEVQKSLAASIPFPARLGRPDEYAQLACQIVENEMLNGEVIRLDGAIRMGAK
jgi:NAD(P)-dependent dehydrogenase (short-subunit alcohol dehydrogenase family)